MSASLRRWLNCPIVTLNHQFGAGSVEWNDQPNTQIFSMGDQIEIKVRTQYKDPYGGWCKFKIWVEKYIPNNDWILIPNGYKEPSYTLSSGAEDRYEWHIEDHSFVVNLDSNVARFRVRVAIKQGRLPNNYTDPETREFCAFVDYFGDFSLDYIPITILYCPPGQDMTNSLKQTSNCMTNLSCGFSKTVGSKNSTGMEISGGIGGLTKFVSGSGLISSSSSETNSQSIGNSVTNMICLNYLWGTNLIADNHQAIGNKFWGPLGDLFLILKNPWLSLRGDEKGSYLIEWSESKSFLTEILVLPAHKLLRPDKDPIASHIPADCRRRMLELDPFITNLDDFFPIDKGLELSIAVNPYQDPSVGNPSTNTGDNRAVRIARYSISNGVILDFSMVSEINFRNINNNETEYFSEVTKTDNYVLNLGIFFDAISLGLSGSNATSKFTRLTYQNSEECSVGKILTATCKLIRNQDETDLSDIEIWWDKHFNTFMFRKIHPCKPIKVKISGTELLICEGIRLSGTVISIDGRRLGNVKINIKSTKSSLYYSTMTDHLGKFSFENIIVGKYEIECGDTKHDLEVTNENLADLGIYIELKNVKRVIDLKNTPLWEFAEACQISIHRAREIQLAMKKEIKLDKVTFSKLLDSFKLKLPNIENRISIKY